MLILHRLDQAALEKLLARAEAEVGRPLPVTAEAREALLASADGDGRFLLNQVETLFDVAIDEPLGPAELAQFLQRRVAVYDKDREGHYNLISALHKSLRGSDPQAALYYMARMLTAGEEPLYVLRRLVRFASARTSASPIRRRWCNASPPRTPTTSSASPEGELAIVQACLYSPPPPNRTPPTRRRKRRGGRPRKPGR